MNGHSALCFIDTNIWLYACILGDDDTGKSAMANTLIQNKAPIVSTQVINEICVNLVKKARFGEIQIRSLIRAFYEKYPVIEPDHAILCHASEVRERYMLSFWDGLIVAAALSADVAALYTEDMQHGLVIDGRLQLINPFMQSLR